MGLDSLRHFVLRERWCHRLKGPQMSEPIDLEHVRVFRVQPGDTVVLRLDRSPSAAEAEFATARLKGFFPHNDCLVIGSGELAVVRPDKPEEVGA